MFEEETTYQVQKQIHQNTSHTHLPLQSTQTLQLTTGSSAGGRSFKLSSSSASRPVPGDSRLRLLLAQDFKESSHQGGGTITFSASSTATT